jgi:hypothetical protein
MPTRAGATAFLSLLLVVLGVVILVQTARAGGQIGYVLGVLFVLAGGGRAWLATRGGWTPPRS